MRASPVGLCFTFAASALCLILSCSTNETSTPPPGPTPAAANAAQGQAAGAMPFTTNLESKKYRMKLDLVGFGVVDARGDLTSKYDEVETAMKGLMNEADKFDLSKQDDLRAFGNRVGQQLKMTGQQKVIAVIRSNESDKELFEGEIRPGGGGQFDLHPGAAAGR